jgi:hypothetical protein
MSYPWTHKCERCGGNPETCRCIVGAWKQVAPDRVVLTDDDREMCVVCGELPANTFGPYCGRCWRAMEEDRLERESGR